MTQRSLLDAVDGDPLALDLDHRDPLPVAALERGISGDIDLVHLKPELRGQRPELVTRPVAEVAVAGREEDDGRVQG